MMFPGFPITLFLLSVFTRQPVSKPEGLLRGKEFSAIEQPKQYESHIIVSFRYSKLRALRTSAHQFMTPHKGSTQYTGSRWVCQR